MSEPVLCYVEGPWAFFTTKPLAQQWGDDWDDAPYQLNAGPPYIYGDAVLIQIAWDGPFLSAASFGNVSVREINRGDVPWLRTLEGDVSVKAGVTMDEFCAVMWQAGGGIWRKHVTLE